MIVAGSEHSNIIFLSHKESGQGVQNVQWIYTATRLIHLINMPHQQSWCYSTRASQAFLPNGLRGKESLASEYQDNFMTDGTLDTRAAGCRSQRKGCKMIPPNVQYFYEDVALE